jgi:flagellar hook-length control protein FliK
MTAVSSADSTGAVYSKTESSAKKEDRPGDSFAELFSIISEDTAKPEAGNKKETGSATSKEETGSATSKKETGSVISKKETGSVISKKEAGSATSKKEDPAESSLPAALQQLYQLMELMKQNVDTEQEQKEITSVMETITGVLEGNGASGDTDIAALLTGIQSQLEGLDSEEKEAIMARMPQIMGLLQEPDSAATEEPIQIGSILCPLENDNEQMELPAQMQAVIFGNDGQEATELSAENEAADALPAEKQAEESGVHPVLKSAENAQNGDAAEDPGMKRQETAEQADQPKDNADGKLPVSDGNPAASATEKPAADTDSLVETGAGHALRLLEELLSSYEEGSSGRFEIQLEPENLGKLSITLSMNEDGLKALIRAKEPEAQSLLASEIGALANKLSENGVQIRSLDVVCSDTGGGPSDRQNTGSAHSEQGFDSHGRRTPEEIRSAYEDSDGSQIYAWTCEEMLGSTVSYRA